jgi:hypothetical protein
LLKRGANATARDSLGRPALVIAINASTTRAHSAGLYARLLFDLLNHGAAEDALVLPYLAQKVATCIFPFCLIFENAPQSPPSKRCVCSCRGSSQQAVGLRLWSMFFSFENGASHHFREANIAIGMYAPA